VAHALQRALAKNPADRFTTPAGFAGALRTGTQPGQRLSRRLGIPVAAAVALVVFTGAWWALRRGSNLGLDPEVIAVMPFRAGGPGMGYLRESMLDLLQARLSGAGPRTVEPRTLLAAWRRAGGNETADLSDDGSRKVARQLGAGRVLLGSAIATPTELTLSGTLLRVSDGNQLARESVAGAPDSIAVLVNRLTAALLIREAGETQERTAGLAAAPLDALQDYLAGRRAYRRGDYFGAMDLYGRAFARDSTFVDAAFAMVVTNAWIGTIGTTSGFQAIPLVSRMRDRLSERDRSLFLAIPWVGPNYPRPSTNAEIIAQAERGAEAAPDSPDHWLLLGQLLDCYGASASRTTWAVRAAQVLDRAIALDSSFSSAISWRLATAIRSRDTTATIQYANLFAARVAAGVPEGGMLWAAARTVGDSATALKWRDPPAESRTEGTQRLVGLALASAAYALPLDDARWAVDRLRRDATTEVERRGPDLAAEALDFAQGRVDLGTDLNWGRPIGPQWEGLIVEQALIEPVYRRQAAVAMAIEAAGGYVLPQIEPATRWPPAVDCFGTLYRVAGGDTTGAAAAIGRLRAFAATARPPIPRDDWVQNDFRVCPLLIAALIERPSASGARPQLDRLDSLMRDGPRGFMGTANIQPAAFANFTIARFREAQGNIPAALAAIRRRDVDFYPAYLWSLPAFLRQEGRLAAVAGDTSGALRAYGAYLTLRTAPDAPFVPQRDSVVAERAALAGRGAR
jgi:hypothetical protein